MYRAVPRTSALRVRVATVALAHQSRWCAGKGPSTAGPSTGGVASTVDPTLDAETQAKVKVVQDMGNDAFVENQEILRNLALRGLRSLVLVCVGLAAFFIALRRKRARDQAYDEAQALLNADTDSDDPTQRYLREMGDLGFDVEAGEEEAAALNAKRAPTKRN